MPYKWVSYSLTASQKAIKIFFPEIKNILFVWHFFLIPCYTINIKNRTRSENITTIKNKNKISKIEATTHWLCMYNKKRPNALSKYFVGHRDGKELNQGASYHI
jgi:hypothetical protein